MDYINKILCGNDLEILPKLPAESVNCCVCSPPYWGLRDYGIEPIIWDGNKDCKHIWKKEITKRPNASGGKTDWAKEKLAIKGVENYQEYVDYHKRETKSDFCLKCGAWRGSLGLEPTFELYIKHLCDTFDQVKRVLRKDGTCFVNMGDSYWGGGQGGADYGGKEIVPESNFGHVAKGKNYLSKSLCDIPYRFSIEMTNRGWIKRNTIIWHKPNCMPSSADDRFTIDFEYLFFFTKNNKAIFWTNEKTLESVSKKPLGTKGIEGRDWEWRETQNWKEEENAGYKIGATDPHRAASIGGLKLGVKHKKSGKLKKVSLWSGHNYWFEQQFEEYKYPLDRWGGIYTDGNVPNSKYLKENIDPAQITKRPRSFRPNEQGRNKRCVWIIPTQPFPEAHFAVYPEGLIEIPIKAGCPEFVCKKCGKARVKILEPTEEYKKLLGKSWHPHKHDAERGMSETPDKKASCTAEYKFKGYTDCGCNAGFESGIVLDPFMGAGTSALVTLKQRKRFIGIEIKQEYIDMSYKRIAKVQQNIF